MDILSLFLLTKGLFISIILSHQLKVRSMRVRKIICITVVLLFGFGFFATTARANLCKDTGNCVHPDMQSIPFAKKAESFSLCFAHCSSAQNDFCKPAGKSQTLDVYDFISGLSLKELNLCTDTSVALSNPVIGKIRTSVSELHTVQTAPVYLTNLFLLC